MLHSPQATGNTTRRDLNYSAPQKKAIFFLDRSSFLRILENAENADILVPGQNPCYIKKWESGNIDFSAPALSREETMGDICQSCQQASIEIIKVLDDPADPYRVCSSCFQRLMSHSLRPREWYNLSSIHGRLNDFLSEEYYDEKNGTALKPAEEVDDAALFPCPTLEEAASSPDRLLTYILSRSHFHEEGQTARWYIHPDLVSSMQRHSPEALLSVFGERLSVLKNTDLIRTIFHLIGLTLEAKGADFIRENWEKFAFTPAFMGIAFAASRCLPLEEAYEKVTHILSGMDIRDRSAAKQILHSFETPLNLDWIEKNAYPPVDSSWGLLAASSKFDWERAKKWLSFGRPLSLVALDALDWRVCSGRKPPLLNPPNSEEFISVLQDYVAKDNVRRVKEQVQKLLEYSQNLAGPTFSSVKGVSSPAMNFQNGPTLCSTCGELQPDTSRVCSCGTPLSAFRTFLEDRLGIRAAMVRALSQEEVDARIRSTPVRFIVFDCPKGELTLITEEKNHEYWEKSFKPKFLEPADRTPFRKFDGGYKATEWQTESHEPIIVLTYFYWPI